MTNVIRNIQLFSALDLHHYQGFGTESAASKNVTPMEKVICTIGHKTASKAMLKRLMATGMNVCRINTSHGSFEEHSETIRNLRELLAQTTQQYCGILLDVGGEIRVGRLKSKTLVVEVGTEINICCDPLMEGDHKMFSLDYIGLVDVLKPGSSLIMSDGISSFTVINVSKERRVVRVRANTQINLTEGKLVYIPSAGVDNRSLEYAVQQEVDFIAIAVQSADEILSLRKTLGDKGSSIGIIAKISSVAAIEKIDEIVKHSFAILVSRGDLGVIIPEEQVFVAQKMLCSRAMAAQKPAIIATQMLYSMIRAPRPTRAECTDVANAVLDGFDCVMLSGETETGDYPVESLAMMADIVRKSDTVERLGDYNSLFEDIMSTVTSEPDHPGRKTPSITEIVAAYAVRIAKDADAQLIVAITETGETPRVVAKFRPRVPIIAITPSLKTAQQLTLTRAAIPWLVPSVAGSDSIIAAVLQEFKAKGLCSSGGKVVAVLGDVEGVPGKVNCFKVVHVS